MNTSRLSLTTENFFVKRRESKCPEETEQDPPARGPARDGVWEEAREDRVAEAAVAVEVVAGPAPVPAETACAPTAVKRRHTRLGFPVTIRNALNAAHP